VSEPFIQGRIHHRTGHTGLHRIERTVIKEHLRYPGTSSTTTWDKVTVVLRAHSAAGMAALNQFGQCGIDESDRYGSGFVGRAACVAAALPPPRRVT